MSENSDHTATLAYCLEFTDPQTTTLITAINVNSDIMPEKTKNSPEEDGHMDESRH